MRVVWDDATLSVGDRAEVEAWIEANESASILTLTVRVDGIVLRARGGRLSFAMRRHFETLTDALDDAMRDLLPT